jgi:glutathione S-transferase
MSGGFTLHGSPHLLPTYRVVLMIRLCGEGFTFRYVSFQRGMHLSPEFRTLSRWGHVLVLVHDNRVFVQSAAILEYLAETLGRFGASDVEARQHIREWLFWDADRLMPPLYAWYSIELGGANCCRSCSIRCW